MEMTLKWISNFSINHQLFNHTPDEDRHFTELSNIIYTEERRSSWKAFGNNNAH